MPIVPADAMQALIMRCRERDLNLYLKEVGIRHFKAGELCTRKLAPRQLWPYVIPTLRFSDMLRDEFGPTAITSGYRDPVHNEDVGGGDESLHLDFNALDQACATGTPQDWDAFLTVKGFRELGGLGVYVTKGFVHTDTRFLVFGRKLWYNLYP